MHLNIKIDLDQSDVSNTSLTIEEMNKYYQTVIDKQDSNLDSGLDLVTPQKIIIPEGSNSYKVSLCVCCEPFFEDNKVRGYYLMPRSSMGKSNLRFSNSIGLIDFSYRGPISMMIDNIGKETVTIEKGTRLCQLVSYDLSPIKISLVDSLSMTERGRGGFGSTGE